MIVNHAHASQLKSFTHLRAPSSDPASLMCGSVLRWGPITQGNNTETSIDGKYGVDRTLDIAVGENSLGFSLGIWCFFLWFI
jgi:hypothetical protein